MVKLRVISIDPGGTTGICLHDEENPLSMKQLQLSGDHHLQLYRLLASYQPHHVVVERFFYQKRNKVELIPVEYIGIVRLYAVANDRPLFEQTPASAMNLWTDEKLKALGYYREGMPHANDAVRHMLYYYTVTRRNLRWVRLLREKEDVAS